MHVRDDDDEDYDDDYDDGQDMGILHIQYFNYVKCDQLTT